MRKSKNSFDNIGTANRLIAAMEIAIENMIQEIQKPVDQELSGSQRKAELQSIKQTAIDAKELIIEREKLQTLIKSTSRTWRNHRTKRLTPAGSQSNTLGEKLGVCIRYATL